MDNLGDLGLQDQLLSARTELQSCKSMITELSSTVRTLQNDNEQLKAKLERLEIENASVKSLLLKQEGLNRGIESITESFTPPPPPSKPAASAKTLTLLSSVPSPHKPNGLTVFQPPNTNYIYSGGVTGEIYKHFYGLYSETGHRYPSSSSSNLLLCTVSSPVISLLEHSKTLYISTMDGSVYSYPPLNLLCKFKKFIVNMTVSKGGVIVASRDGVLKCLGGEGWEVKFSEGIECVASNDERCYVYTDGVEVKVLEGGVEVEGILLNERMFDTHQSFRVGWMEVGGEGGEVLACCTSKSRIILFSTSSRVQLTSLYSHVSEDYHVPRCFFDPTGTLVVGNSEDDVIYVWEAGGGDVRQRIAGEGDGHKGKVRDLKGGEGGVSLGWDGWIKVWGWV
ncbi:hypothetical protein TrVE_jg14425 [Triparma verrucosa]|uniref:Uncharacterized protein n=2 Tax=Triparma TaxID=722752 RepID=A0A9W7AN90_9STRA|nr:hypothetical protein TrST_g6008 [Triparma strigata]GMH96483.1 hypothetical protein TrVE_jg14425 [Triparma verrucosa]